MTLDQMKLGAVGVISIRRVATIEEAERLDAFGLCVGSRVRLLRLAPFHGPLLIEECTSGARTMMARAMARGIEVREVGDEPS